MQCLFFSTHASAGGLGGLAASDVDLRRPHSSVRELRSRGAGNKLGGSRWAAANHTFTAPSARPHEQFLHALRPVLPTCARCVRRRLSALSALGGRTRSVCVRVCGMTCWAAPRLTVIHRRRHRWPLLVLRR